MWKWNGIRRRDLGGKGNSPDLEKKRWDRTHSCGQYPEQSVGTVQEKWISILNESRALIEEAIDIWENQYGRDNLQYANGKNNLGLVFEKNGTIPQALKPSRKPGYPPSYA